MGTETGLPDAAASGSPNKGSAAKTEIAARLDIQRELDHKRGEARTSSDPPRRARRLRVAAALLAILAVLGIGWSVDLKTREFVNIPAAAWVLDAAGSLVSILEAQRQQIVAGIQGLASTSAPPETISPNGAPKNVAEVIETVASGLYVKIDQVRAASVRSIGELGTGVDRLNGAMERNQRDLMARLDRLQERLDRMENHAAGAAHARQAQPLEKPAAEKSAPLPLQPAATASAAGAQKPKAAPVKRIENWAVREVVDGMAILAGPRGLVGVVSGDVVPGLGRVESISRRDGRWVVATRKGVITGQ
jgi:hypothetical protein